LVGPGGVGCGDGAGGGSGARRVGGFDGEVLGDGDGGACFAVAGGVVEAADGYGGLAVDADAGGVGAVAGAAPGGEDRRDSAVCGASQRGGCGGAPVVGGGVVGADDRHRGRDRAHLCGDAAGGVPGVGDPVGARDDGQRRSQRGALVETALPHSVRVRVGVGASVGRHDGAGVFGRERRGRCDLGPWRVGEQRLGAGRAVARCGAGDRDRRGAAGLHPRHHCAGAGAAADPRGAHPVAGRGAAAASCGGLHCDLVAGIGGAGRRGRRVGTIVSHWVTSLPQSPPIPPRSALALPAVPFTRSAAKLTLNARCSSMRRR